MNEERFRRALRLLSEGVAPAKDAPERVLKKLRRHRLRRQMTSGVALLAAVSVGIVVVQQIRPDEGPPPSLTSDDPTTSPSPSQPDVTGGPIAFAFDGDVFVREVEGGIRRVTDDGSDAPDSFPLLQSSERVLWVQRSTGSDPSIVWEMDLDTGERGALAEIDGAVYAFTAHPDNMQLAFVVVGEGRAQPRVLVLDAGDQRFLRTEDPGRRGELAKEYWTFPVFLGRGGTPEDEVRVSWSPDGSRLLVVNTLSYSPGDNGEETMVVLDGPESTAAPSLHATFGRWISDDQVVYRGLSDSRWRILSVDTGDERVVEGWPRTGRFPEISPDRQMIVMQQDHPAPELPSLFVADLETTRPVIRQAPEGLWPLWIDNRTVIATDVEPCLRSCIEHWRRASQTFRLGLDDGQTSSFDIPVTFDANVYSPAAGGSN